MPIVKLYKKSLQISGTILILLCGFSFAAAQNFSKDRFNKPSEAQPEDQIGKKDIVSVIKPSPLSAKKKISESTVLQQTARLYRQQGLEYQDAGNLEAALTFYQKAVELDPWYAAAYNDAGIILESKGDFQRAQVNYLQAIKIDPEFLSPYSNLAMLYETRRDLKSALAYWTKRARLGASEDEWTQRARQRAKDIELVLYGPQAQDDRKKISQEEDIVGLFADIKARKAAAVQQKSDTVIPPAIDIEKREKPPKAQQPPCEDKPALAKKMLRKAKASQKKGNHELALKQGIDAKFLDPDNPEIQEFLDKALTKALAK